MSTYYIHCSFAKGLVKVLLILTAIHKVDIIFSILPILDYPVMQEFKAGLFLKPKAFHFGISTLKQEQRQVCALFTLKETHEIQASQTPVVKRSFITPLTVPKKNRPWCQITLGGLCVQNFILSPTSIFHRIEGTLRVMDLLLSASFREQVYRFVLWLLTTSSDFIPAPDA